MKQHKANFQSGWPDHVLVSPGQEPPFVWLWRGSSCCDRAPLMKQAVVGQVRREKRAQPTGVQNVASFLEGACSLVKYSQRKAVRPGRRRGESVPVAGSDWSITAHSLGLLASRTAA